MLIFNDLPLPCPNALTLAQLLESQQVDERQVATAVNGTFVPRDQRATTQLQPGDTVLTFHTIVGG
jgi:sulfur carrier protein